MPDHCAMTPATHFVHFYDTESELIDAVSRYVHDGLDADSTCLVIATAEHRERIAGRLMEMGLNPGALAAEYQYIALDARLILLSFMSDEGPDQQRFHQTMGQLMRQAASRGQPVRVFGEMVALLAAKNQVRYAIQLEELWNELSRQQNFTLYCAYPNTAFRGDSKAQTLIRAVHSHVM